MAKNYGRVWAISKEELAQIVAREKSLGKILAHFGLLNKGGNANTLKRRLTIEGIDFSHIPLGRASNRVIPRGGVPRTDDSLILVKGTTYSRSSVRRAAQRSGVIPYICSLCGMGPEWQGKPLVLVLDHISGDGTNSEPSNLRFVCPNCNAQLDTHCGGNKPRVVK